MINKKESEVKKEKDDAQMVALILENHEALMETFILADINKDNNNNYINISVYGNLQGLAPEALMEMHSSQKRGLSGHLGSIPGWGAPCA